MVTSIEVYQVAKRSFGVGEMRNEKILYLFNMKLTHYIRGQTFESWGDLGGIRRIVIQCSYVNLSKELQR